MRRTRAIALATILSLLSSCGYILYPERRGNNGGVIDGGTLVMDLLWLLPGIVPGVVFLIVDFTSGAMYVGGGRYALKATPDGDVAVKLNDSKVARTLELRLVNDKKQILDRKLESVGPQFHDLSVNLHGSAHQKMHLEIVDPQIGTPLQVPVAVL
ncbi:MAG TPA: hypothetical protein VGC41_05285 [Kofleriaceae bacterium]